MLWLLASEHADGAIPYKLESIAFRLHMTSDKVDAALGPLIGAGFLIEEQDASEPLAAGKQPALPEREKERDRDKERGRARRARARGADQGSRGDRFSGPCAGGTRPADPRGLAGA